MDLPYPSFRKQEGCEQNVLNSMNKKLRSTIWSMNDLGKQEQNLPIGTRNELVKCIQKNNANKLRKLVEKGKIKYETEIGNKGSKWSFLHYCARWDAITCLEMILKDKYRTSPNELLFFMNAKTCEGYTALMIAVLNNSNHFIAEFLDYGGIDIFLVDNNKVTAYQIAIAQKNEEAAQRLVDYERENKAATFLNTYKLCSKFESPLEEKRCNWSWLWRWLFRQQKSSEIVDTATNRPLAKRYFIDSEFPATAFSVCRNVEFTMAHNIEWYRIEDLFAGKSVPLFGSFSPYEIKQTNFVINHCLSVFQAMVQYPWIIRTKIRKCPNEGMYTCLMYPKGQQWEITVDDLVPCVKSTKQPMFFSNTKQSWPMILQKAWVKTYGSYTLARDIAPKIMFQELLGFHSETFSFSQRPDGLFSKLKSLTKKGYLVVLTSKLESSLKQDNCGPESFGLLSLTEKDGKQYFLINCPFLLPEWKEKEKFEALSLRLIRSHYNSANQMAVWMDTEQLYSNFASLTVCYGDPSMIRTEFRVKARQCIFFKYQCNDNISPQPLLLKVYKANSECVQVKIKSIEVSRDEIISPGSVLSHQDSYNKLKSVEVGLGSYVCKLELEEKDVDVVVVGYCQHSLHLEPFDEELGKIEWLYMLRDLIASTRTPSDTLLCEKFYQYLILVDKSAEKKEKSSVLVDFDRVEYVVQGFRETDRVILERCDDYWYGIVKIRYGEDEDGVGIVLAE